MTELAVTRSSTSNFTTGKTNRVSKSVYRPEIDGLRAFAIIAVLINHFNKDLLPGGYLGVDIFFVISGYLVTSSLANQSHKDFRDFLLNFYTRRIKRLVPVLVLVVAITSVLVCLVTPAPRVSLQTGLTSLFGLSNFYLLKQATDYFGFAAEMNVFTQTWSLGVEEQFYFLFPFLVWFSGFGRQSLKGSRNLSWMVVVLSVCSLFIFFYLNQGSHSTAYFLMPSRFWELGAGCLMFLYTREKAGLLLETIQRGVVSTLVLILMIGTLFVPHQFFSLTTVAIVLSTCVLIASLRTGTPVYHLLTNRIIVYIGLISYSLYLWHWTVISLSRYTIGLHLWTSPILLTLIFLLSVMSYHYVEKPLRHAEWSALRWKTIGYGLGACAGTAGMLVLLIKPLYGQLYTAQKPTLIKEGVESLDDPYQHRQFMWKGKPCVLAHEQDVGKKFLLMHAPWAIFRNARKRILVIGNSFSVALLEAFVPLAERRGVAILVTSAFGAAVVKELSPDDDGAKKSHAYYWNKVIPEFVDQLRSGDVVLMVNDIANLSPKVRTAKSEQRLQVLRAGLEVFSEELSSRGISLAVVHGNPFIREANCSLTSAAKQWFAPFGGVCNYLTKDETLQRRSHIDAVLTGLQLKRRLTIIDLMGVFCPDNVCSYYGVNSIILYRDEYSHPSVEASRLASSVFGAALFKE